MTFFSFEPLFAELFRRSIDPDTGEIVNPHFRDELDRLSMEKDERVEQAALAYKDAMVEIKAAEDLVKSLQAKIKKKKASADFFKSYVSDQVGDESLKTPLVSIYHGTSKSCDIVREEDIPEEFFKVEKTVKKADILKLLKEGKDIPGAELKVERYLVIK